MTALASRTRACRRGVLVGLLALGVVACGGKVPPIHYYTLRLPAAAASVASMTGTTRLRMFNS